MSTKIATYNQNGQPNLRPEFGMRETVYCNRVTVTYMTSESADAIFHRFASSGNPTSERDHIQTISVTEIKKVSWSQVREYKESAIAARRAG